MSDLGMFNTALEHRTVEVVAWQWDGTKGSAMAGCDALQRELPIRGASLERMQHHAQKAISGDGLDANEVSVAIKRRADGMYWSGTVRRGQWLIVWLHHDLVNHVEILEREYGDLLLHPLNPIVTLHPRRKEITDV